MGHVRVGDLPDTKRWRHVVRLLPIGAGVEQIQCRDARC